MAAKIKLKRETGGAGDTPTTSDIEAYEIAQNVTDKRLFGRDGSNNIFEFGINPTSITTGAITATGTVTANSQLASSNAVLTGGSVNNMVIGASTAAAITGTLITANTNFAGNITGNVTGNVTGNITGNTTGDLTGNVTASSGTSTFNNLVINGTVDFNTAVLTDLGSPSNATDAATKGYVDTEITNLIGGAPGALDTLNELAAALNDDASFNSTITTSIAAKLPLAGGTMTGAIAMGSNKVTGLDSGTASGDAVNKGQLDTMLPLAGGTMTGNIAIGSNVITSSANPSDDTHLARKAYVDSILGSATSAATSASAASTSATNAASSATAAASSATSAASSATAAAASYDTFDDRFLGAKSSDPSADNDGDSLVTGALYFNSSSNAMKVYTGSAWAAVAPTATSVTVSQVSDLTATAAEINLIDGSTAGTVVASKAVVVDANKDIASFRNITLTGELDAGSLDVSGDVDIDGTLEADAITIDGVTLSETIADTVGAMVGSNTETGISVTYEDGDNTLDFVLDAAQTGITSLLATDIKIGEDDQTKIDFETADEIHFYANNVEQVYLGDNIFGPQSDSDVDLGSSSVRWKDAYVDSITVTGEVDAASLDISGDVDIDGTLETDNLTIGGAQGSDGQVLTSTGSGVAWEDAAGGGLTLVSDKVFGGTSGPTAVGSTSVVIGAGTGADLTTSAHSLTVIGGDSLNVSTTTGPQRLVVVGSDAARKMGSGALDSVYIGHESCQDGGTETTGTHNTAVGAATLKKVSSGSYNTCIGSNVGAEVTDGANNVFIGGDGASGTSSTSAGSNNVAIGVGTANNYHGSGNILIGKGCGLLNLTSTNRIVIGTTLFGDNNDRTVSLGDNTGYVYASYASSASWTQTSDERLKKNIADDTLGLSFINDLRTVTYKWKPISELDDSVIRKDPVTGDVIQGEKDTEQTFHGLIAQEVKTAMDNAGCTTFDGWTQESDTGIQGVSREQFVIPLIKAVQELSAEIVSLKSRLSALED